MQNLNPGSNDSVTTSEAQQILAAWSNRMAAQGVDPQVGSVQGLAANLGVSEDHVRQMLEDIRVQKRSQALAAGIMEEQHKHRKKSDVNAAIVAAIAILLVVIGAGAFFFFADRGVNPAVSSSEQITHVTVPIPEIPPIPNFGNPPLFVDRGDRVAWIGVDGHTITIKADGTYTEIIPGGSTVSMRGKQALDRVGERIQEEKKRIETLTATRERTEFQEGELTEAKQILAALQSGEKLLKAQIDTPLPGAPVAAPSED
jgi:hypothetical protein